jgi:hypothetical protein
MESTDQAPPASFERQLSSQEERDVLINFMGNIYGESKKLDGNIIGASSTLSNNKSSEIRQHIEKLVHEPHKVIASSLPVIVPDITPAVHVPVVDIPSTPAAATVTPAPVAAILVPDVDPNQLSFNFDVNEKAELFDLVNKVLTRLDKLHRKVDEITDQIKCQQPVKKKSAPQKKAVK